MTNSNPWWVIQSRIQHQVALPLLRCVSLYAHAMPALARGAHSCYMHSCCYTVVTQLRSVPCKLTSCLLLRVALTVFFVFRLYAHIVPALARGAHSMRSCVPFLVSSRHTCSCAGRSQYAILRFVVSCDRIVNPCRLMCVVSSHHGGHGCW